MALTLSITEDNGGEYMNEEAKMVLKLHLCNSFIDALADEGLITRRQRGNLRAAVKKRITMV